MSVDESLLREALASRDRLLELQHESERARADHHHAIRRLHAAGASMREIGELLGLSHQRIHQIIETDAAGGTGVGGRKGLLARLAGRGEGGEPMASKARERLTGETRAALSIAQAEARALNHNYLGTEHLLLGLVGVKGALAGRILSSLGVDPKQIRTALADRLVGRGAAPPSPGAIPFTPRSKKALELAHKEAGTRGSMVGSEHLLLAILRVRDGLAARILRDLGVEEAAVRGRLGRADCRCSFCRRDGLVVEHLVAGPGVYICERCVERAGELRAGGRAAEGLTLLSDEAGICGFCGRDAGQVGQIVAGPEATICEHCLNLCREIRDEEQRS